MRKLKPLYRKKKTPTHDKYVRHRKTDAYNNMRTENRGLDYTPLYMYLLNSVGQDWNLILSKIKLRVLDINAVYYIVDKTTDDFSNSPYAYIYDEFAAYSTLFVDKNNILQVVNPNIKNTTLFPRCSCHTHTFNGVPLINKYKGSNR